MNNNGSDRCDDNRSAYLADALEVCPHCGQSHATKCPLVKAVEYHQDGTMKRIEFFAPVDYDRTVRKGAL